LGLVIPGNKNLVSNFVLKPPLKKENELIEDSILNSYKIFSLLKSGQFEKAMLNLHSV
jgi:PTH1 family peptidyl-tRNA hydrolase